MVNARPTGRKSPMSGGTMDIISVKGLVKRYDEFKIFAVLRSFWNL